MIDDIVLNAIRSSLAADPSQGPLWVRYAQMLSLAQRVEEALSAFRSASDLNALPAEDCRQFITLLREQGHLAEALIRVEKALETSDDPGLRDEFEKIQLARGQVTSDVPPVVTPPSDESPSQEIEETRRASVVPDDVDVVLGEVESRPITRFSDVVGLDDVKQQIFLRIIAPFKKQEIYKAFSRKAGGGILLYGPPGCGKTLIARATAGECDARFVSVSIHDIIDEYWGRSEKYIHQIFEDARRASPTVLFFDEFDALGASRGKSGSQFWKTLVDQILHEMDGIDSNGAEILVFAATNMPWGVDPAFRRPGRFDRLLFVTPPDELSKTELFRRFLADLPGGSAIDAAALAKSSPLLTGADIKGLCERSAERALLRSIESNQVHPVSLTDVQEQLRRTTSSAAEWLATARNYARYSNEGGQYDELVSYLKKVKMY